MERYIIMGSTNDFLKASYYDLKNLENVIYLDGKINNEFLEILYRIYFRLKLPPLCIWNAIKYGKLPKDNGEYFYFIFFTDAVTLNGIKYVEFIKKKYKKCKMIVFFQDLIEKITDKCDINALLSTFDLALSFDFEDSEVYGCQYYPLVYSKGWCNVNFNANPFYDVFFVGKAKDRFNKIIAIYEMLTSKGLKCDFHITGVEMEKRVYADEIDYCSQMSYEIYLNKMINSKSILEIMQGGGTGYTLRTNEAIAYGKKLITDNINIKKAPFYNEKYIYVLNDIERFDETFIQNGDVNYGYLDKLSPIKLLEYIHDFFALKEGNQMIERGIRK